MLPRLTPLCICGALLLSPLLALAAARDPLRRVGVASTNSSADSSLMDFTGLAALNHSSLALHVSRIAHLSAEALEPV
ncbi:MAG TPA: hypothetical protein VNZ64_20185 [Candidatus Acidoferrum sp.]|jgi:hypothetical protein|nr:hypothetical protein [Candidatus Acidoferrum sp.]